MFFYNTLLNFLQTDIMKISHSLCTKHTSNECALLGYEMYAIQQTVYFKMNQSFTSRKKIQIDNRQGNEFKKWRIIYVCYKR